MHREDAALPNTVAFFYYICPPPRWYTKGFLDRLDCPGKKGQFARKNHHFLHFVHTHSGKAARRLVLHFFLPVSFIRYPFSLSADARKGDGGRGRNDRPGGVKTFTGGMAEGGAKLSTGCRQRQCGRLFFFKMQFVKMHLYLAEKKKKVAPPCYISQSMVIRGRGFSRPRSVGRCSLRF